MAFTIKPATRADNKALIGLYGQSGAGKTMSGLLLARGAADGGMVVLIDTESGRGSLYADVIPGGYGVIDLEPPYTPERYIAAIDAAEKAGAAVIVIDSISHEWESQGGISDMVAEIERRTGRPGLHCWKEPKMEHQKLLFRLLRSKTHVIVCLRAKRKSRQMKDEKTGKSVIVKDDHFTPKQDSDFIFEMTVHAEVLADHTLRVTKVSHPGLAQFFKNGLTVTEHTGQWLAKWAKGDLAEPEKAKPALQPSVSSGPASADPLAGANPDLDGLTPPSAKSGPMLAALTTRLRAAETNEAIDAILSGETEMAQIDWLESKWAAGHERLYEVVAAVRAKFRAAA